MKQTRFYFQVSPETDPKVIRISNFTPKPDFVLKTGSCCWLPLTCLVTRRSGGILLVVQKKWAVGILKCCYKRAEDVLIELLILIVDINILKMSQPHLNQSTKQCICISTEYWMSIRLSVWTAFWSENQMMTFDKIRNVDSTKI